jgi:hypothetical protein
MSSRRQPSKGHKNLEVVDMAKPQVLFSVHLANYSSHQRHPALAMVPSAGREEPTSDPIGLRAISGVAAAAGQQPLAPGVAAFCWEGKRWGTPRQQRARLDCCKSSTTIATNPTPSAPIARSPISVDSLCNGISILN